MIVLDRIEIRRVHWTPVLALQARGKLSLREPGLFPSVPKHLTETLHSSLSAPATAARRLLPLKIIGICRKSHRKLQSRNYRNPQWKTNHASMIASASPQGQDALLFFRLNTILKARALHSNLRACAGFRDARSGTLHGVTSGASGAAGGAPCLYGVHCRCFCSLIVKEELNIFSLGLSPNLEAEEKMWWGVGRG